MASQEIILAEFEDDIRSHEANIAQYLGPDAEAYEITSPTDYEEAGEIINEIKRGAKTLEMVEKSATAPALQSVETIRSWFRPARKQAEQAMTLWKGKIATYLKRQAEEQQAVQARLQTAAQAGKSDEVRQELARLETAPQAKGVSIRHVWKFQVINKNIVPTEFTIVDEAAITAEMKRQVAAGETPVIAGVKFWQEQQVAATGR